MAAEKATTSKPRGVPVALGLLAAALVARECIVTLPEGGVLPTFLHSMHYLGLGGWAAAVLVKIALVRAGGEERERLAALTLADRQLTRFAPVEGLALFAAGGTGASLFPLLYTKMAAREVSPLTLACCPAAGGMLATAAGLFFLGWLAVRPGYWPKPDPRARLGFFFPEIKFAAPSLGLLALASLIEMLAQGLLAPHYPLTLRLLNWLSLTAITLGFGLGVWYCLGLVPSAGNDLSDVERRLVGGQARRLAFLLKFIVMLALLFTLSASLWAALVFKRAGQAVGPQALLPYLLLALAVFLVWRPDSYSLLTALPSLPAAPTAEGAATAPNAAKADDIDQGA